MFMVQDRNDKCKSKSAFTFVIHLSEQYVSIFYLLPAALACCMGFTPDEAPLGRSC